MHYFLSHIDLNLANFLSANGNKCSVRIYRQHDISASANHAAREPRSTTNIVCFAREQLGFDPDPRQTEVLESTAKRGILNCTRQWGKSTVAAIKALHTAHSKPGSLVLVASPGERQSSEFLKKTEELVLRLNIKPRGDGKNSCSLLLPNGSRIIGLPGTEATVRGFSSVALLLIDEAARVADSMYKALRPMLAVADGDLWMMSTPCGQQGFFFETWQNGDPAWHRVSVPATQCPRISKSFLDEELKATGGISFRQEYLCEFTENARRMFNPDLLRAALRDIEPLRL
jgi:hypothetical protein